MVWVTTNGDIEFKWQKSVDTFKAELVSPMGTIAEIYLPRIGSGNVYVNGKPAIECDITVDSDGDYFVLKNLAAGHYEFEIKY